MRLVGPVAGERVLDVACGTGNSAIPSARAGARVVALDLVPELVEETRRRAAEEGVEIECVVGNAERLPYEDESFDVVLSAFGVMFAPRQALAAGELSRVLRPGGRLGLCNWTPDGAIGELFRAVATHAPPLPPEMQPPILWGSEEHVRGLFAGSGIRLEFTRGEVEFAFGSVHEAADVYATKLGPIAILQDLLPEERWRALVDDLRAFVERHNEATDGRVSYRAEYLLVTGVKAAPVRAAA